MHSWIIVVYRSFVGISDCNVTDSLNLSISHDVGGVPDVCNFLFLPILGPSLKDLLDVRTPSYQTAIQITVQTLRSIKNFYALEEFIATSSRRTLRLDTKKSRTPFS
ncbi:hypothetical protein M3Y98_00922600 [Aphelenchoides besseyi]|nr:hypothetical protein M3Y98_00922600 [Aphelenchoides besseyi]